MSTQINVTDALREAEAGLEVAIQRILKRDPGHAVHVTSEAKALVVVRQALSQCNGCAVQQGYVPMGSMTEIKEPVPNVQLTAPKVIHLNIGSGAEDCDFKELHEVTWCDHDATGGSIQYVRADLATHLTQQGLDAQTEAARSVLAERARQVAAKGWTPERDDEYTRGILGEAGGIYALHAFDPRRAKEVPEGWPWDDAWWKPKDPRTNLVKAGALILAEIERMDRACAAQAKQGVE